MLLLTRVLPTAACAGQWGRCVQQVADRHGQVVIGIHQPGGARHDAMPVRVRVVGEGDAVLVLEADQPRHRIGTRAVHANLSVVIDRHEGERRIDDRVHDHDVEPVDGVDRLPVGHGRATQGVHAQPEAGAADGIHIDDVPQVVDVGQDEVLLVRGGRLDGRRERHALDVGIGPAQQLIGAVLHPRRHVRIGGAAVGRVVLEAAVLRRIVRRRDHDAICEARPPAAVVDENRAAR